MNIEDLIVTARDKDRNVIATVSDYYDKYVHPWDSKYSKRSLKNEKLVLCPFHGDTDPSMGLLKDKKDKDVEVFHCFGCGASGNIVKFHRRFVNLAEGRVITLEKASEEVARLYGIQIDEQEVEERINSLLGSREVEIMNKIGQYDFRAYAANLMQIRMNQDRMSVEDLGKNLDVVMNKWKLAVKQTSN